MGPPIKGSDKVWLQNQHVFFHATAPLNKNHRVNVSPKSAEQFRVINDDTVCWLDYSGSGSETAAHVLENGRLTIMFVALNGPPKIMRLHGTGKIVLPTELMSQDTDENLAIRKLYDGELVGQAKHNVGFRCIVVLHVTRVTHSCGYSIPIYDYVKERPTLNEFAAKRGVEGIKEYRALKNSVSIDGLPSIGQLEQGDVPSSVEWKDGYYFATYGGGLVGKARTMVSSIFSRGLVGTQRDVAVFALGAAIGVMLMRVIKLRQ